MLVILLVVFVHCNTYPHITYRHQHFLMYLFINYSRFFLLVIFTFNTNTFSLFTSDDTTLSPNAIPQQSTIHSNFISFLQNDHKLRLHVYNEIIDPSFPIPDPTVTSEDNVFDGWFGIKFQDYLHTTHVRSPHPSEILHLYHLPLLNPLYPSFLSPIAI